MGSTTLSVQLQFGRASTFSKKERKKERGEAYALAANGHPKKKMDPGMYLQSTNLLILLP